MWPASADSSAPNAAARGQTALAATQQLSTTASAFDMQNLHATQAVAWNRAMEHKAREEERIAAQRRAHTIAAVRAARLAAQQRAQQQAAQQRAAQQARSSARAASTPSGSPQQIASAMLASFGWGQDQFSCLDSLWAHESGWNPSAANPSSGAYGIPQALPGSKMASAGPDWQTNPATQIRWGLGYIQSLYGSPCGAWAHEQATGYY